jgi:hypothetical protein
MKAQAERQYSKYPAQQCAASAPANHISHNRTNPIHDFRTRSIHAARRSGFLIHPHQDMPGRLAIDADLEPDNRRANVKVIRYAMVIYQYGARIVRAAFWSGVVRKDCAISARRRRPAGRNANVRQ